MKFWLISKKKVTIALCLLVAAAMFGLINHPAFVGVTATTRELPIYCVQRDQKVVALSFDAAWGNEDTQELIEILETYQVKTTFFVVGEWAEKFPESVEALHDAGHEIMSHSADHAHYNTLSREELMADLEQANQAISDITGVVPTLIRTPYGEYNDQVVSTIRAYGMEPIQWDVDSLDWKDLSADEITQRVLSKVEPGSIVLFHNAALNTPAALPDILQNLLSQGYSIVPISQILLPGEYQVDYTIDHTGRQMQIME